MNLILFLIGGFFVSEGSLNVWFFSTFYKRRYPKNVNRLFQFGRFLRAVLGAAVIICSFM